MCKLHPTKTILIALVFIFTALSAKTDPQTVLLNNLLASFSEKVKGTNQEFQNLYKSKDFNFAIYHVDLAKITIGLNPNFKIREGQVIPLISYGDDPLSDYLIKQAKRYSTELIEDSDLNLKLLEYFANLAKISQLRLMTSEKFWTGHPSDQTGRSKQGESLENQFFQTLQSLSVTEYISKILKVDLEKINEVPKMLKQKMKEVKSEIKEGFDSLKTEFQKLFNKKVNGQGQEKPLPGNNQQRSQYLSQCSKKLIKREKQAAAKQLRLKEEGEEWNKKKFDLQGREQQFQRRRGSFHLKVKQYVTKMRQTIQKEKASIQTQKETIKRIARQLRQKKKKIKQCQQHLCQQRNQFRRTVQLSQEL